MRRNLTLCRKTLDRFQRIRSCDSKGKEEPLQYQTASGYGVSIYLKDHRVILKDGNDILTNKSEKEEWFVTQLPYEKIVISGKGYVSTESIKLLAEKNINVILTDTYGNLISNMNNVMSSNTATNYRIGQYETFRDPDKRLYLQKQLVIGKLNSQIGFFKSLDKEELVKAIEQFIDYKESINSYNERRKFLSIESSSNESFPYSKYLFQTYLKYITEVFIP